MWEWMVYQKRTGKFSTPTSHLSSIQTTSLLCPCRDPHHEHHILYQLPTERIRRYYRTCAVSCDAPLCTDNSWLLRRSVPGRYVSAFVCSMFWDLGIGKLR
jgi:hypothetical protein